MRLLNVRTRQLEELFGSQIPKYAILSHTWGQEEVTFSDIHTTSAQAKVGYTKFENVCSQAARDGYHLVWIDTCCIDKSSSSELSEAINSMFLWYQEAGVCYAYLEDVPASEIGEFFGSSRWFTRGWTLQELIAPKQVVFFGKHWTRLGTKASLADVVLNATGINKKTLLDPQYLRRNSVAQRMSWASKRSTTRVEDMAYSLLGIFDLNMAVLYGEGTNAFVRLQEEIMKNSDDQSLFAWGIPCDRHGTPKNRGILAPTVREFANAGNIVPLPSKAHTPPYMMTHKGLQIQLALLSGSFGQPLEEIGCFIGLLHCQFQDDFSGCLGIMLEQIDVPNILVRLDYRDLGLRKIIPEQAAAAEIRTVYILKDHLKPVLNRPDGACWVRSQSLRDHGFLIVKAYPTDFPWNVETQTMRVVCFRVDYVRIAHFLFYNRKINQGFIVSVSFPLDIGECSVRIGPKQAKVAGQTLDKWFWTFPSEPYRGHWSTSRNFKDDDGGDIVSHFKVLATCKMQEVLNQEIFVLDIEMEQLAA